MLVAREDVRSSLSFNSPGDEAVDLGEQLGSSGGPDPATLSVEPVAKSVDKVGLFPDLNLSPAHEVSSDDKRQGEGHSLLISNQLAQQRLKQL